LATKRPGPTSAALGRGAESLARRFVEAKGMLIIEVNKRTAGGELDLVAWDDEVLVFIEVKARSGNRFGRPEEAVDQKKRDRLIRAAGAFLAEAPGPAPICRFDVVSVELGQGEGGVRHIKDAFRPGD
jgi:putative endonuclease